MLAIVTMLQLLSHSQFPRKFWRLIWLHLIVVLFFIITVLLMHYVLHIRFTGPVRFVIAIPIVIAMSAIALRYIVFLRLGLRRIRSD